MTGLIRLRGGVNRDVTHSGMILAGVQKVRKALKKEVISIFTHNTTVKACPVGIGVLKHQDAVAYGTVGPLMRTSRVECYIGEHLPNDTYSELGF